MNCFRSERLYSGNILFSHGYCFSAIPMCFIAGTMKNDKEDGCRRMKFSVLMSVYFKENPVYFDLALKSNLIDQTLKPDEFILVCDGKLTTELEEVINKYTELFPNIFKVYRLAENKGLGTALNYGLEKCSYEIVARADSDDISDSERFEKQLNFLESNKDIDVLGAAIDEFDSDVSNPLHIKFLPTESKKIYEFAKFRNPVNHVTAVFKKNVIEAAGSYKHILYLEDYYLWLRVINNGYKIANLNDVLVHVRIGNGMVRRRGSRDYISGWEKLSCYMLENKMINKAEYLRNILAVRIFVYMPAPIKNFSYKTLLRKNKIGK